MKASVVKTGEVLLPKVEWKLKFQRLIGLLFSSDGNRIIYEITSNDYSFLTVYFI